MFEEIIKKERDMKLRYEKLISKKSKHECLIKDCKEKSILSHAISKTTLKHIAQENHLIYRKFDRANFNINDFIEPNNVNMKFETIGINEASTFKGFCKKHDNNIFEQIDNKNITTLRDVLLQLYRTTCKNYFLNDMVKEAEIDILKKEHYFNTNFINKQEVNLENIILFLDDLLDDFPNEPFYIKDNEVLFFSPVSNIQPNLLVMLKKTNIKFPIALESSFALSLNNKYYTSIVIIIPTENSSIIIVLTHKDLEKQFTPSFRNNLKILNFVESIMMLDSEFYIDPKEFESWSQEKKDIIKTDLYFFNERKFMQEYDISIFDNLRKMIISEENIDIQQYELKKINYKPIRESLKNRFWKLGQFIERIRKL
jgi:hypothetical protein